MAVQSRVSSTSHFSLKFRDGKRSWISVLDWTRNCLGDFTFVRVSQWKDFGDIRRLEVHLHCCYRNCIQDGGVSNRRV